MGNRYKEEKPFALYDPEQDREGLRPAPPRHRSAPVSPRGPISPRAQPPGLYPPESEPGYNSRSGLAGSSQEKPFGYYDPELDRRERPRQGMGPQSRPLDSEPGYSSPAPPSPAGVDGGVGRGVPPPPYIKQDSDHLPMPQGAPPNGSYGRGAPDPGYAGRGVSGRGRGGGGYGERPAYGEGESGYARPVGRGRGSGGVPSLGDGKYVYGGFQQSERLDLEEEYGAPPPAPISSEYAHQVYATVFSDPVYGGARQLNSRAGYHEEPNSLQQAHHREDVLRHPDEF